MDEGGAAGADQTLNFIRDEPAKEDFFQSHSRLATAVVAAMRGQAGLKVIGLLGPWGSGKSTAITFIERELKKDFGSTKVYCFKYDAWLLQNDPPRRAFLESLIHFLIEEDVDIKEKEKTRQRWRRRLGQLTGAIETSETTHTPSLTTAGRFLLASLFAVPLGLPLLGYSTIHAAFGTHPSGVARITFFAGVALILLPALTAAGLYLSWRPKEWPRGWTTWTQHREGHEEDSILSIVVNKNSHTTKTKILRDPEPTTIEFQDIFREIMSDVAADDRRFVFIVDNLDRLPEEDAVSMWGTIRSFFLGATETAAVRKASELPTVILPIDHDAVRRMYAATHGEDADGLASSFMDKTFDLTFRVAKPVMSHWKGYLENQFRYVFGDKVTEENIDNASTFYEEASRTGEIDITPRTVNSLVNYIGTIWLQYLSMGVSFDTMSYYAVFRSRIERGILEASNAPQAGIAEIDPDWRRSIAAIYYGAEPDVAAQIMIEQPLREAIVENDSQKFMQYASVPGFAGILRRVVEAPPQLAAGGGDPAFLGYAARLLDAAELPDNAPLNKTWRSICDGLIKAAPWKTPTAEVNSAVEVALKHCQSATRLGSMLRTVGSKMGAVEGNELTTVAAQQAFVAVAKTLKTAATSGSANAPVLTVPGDAGSYLSVLSHSIDEPELMKQLATKVPVPELVQRLAANLSDNAQALSVEKQTKALLARGGNVAWAGLTQAAGNVVREQNGQQPTVAAALAVLCIFYGRDNAIPPLVQLLANEGHLYNRATEAGASGAATPLATALLLMTNANFAPPGGGDWSPFLADNPSVGEKIDDALLEMNRDGSSRALVSLAQAHPPMIPLVKMIVTRRVKSRTLGRLVLVDVINQMPEWTKCLADGVEDEFINSLTRYDNFWQRLSETDFSGNPLITYHSLLKNSNGIDSPIAAAVRDRLEAVTRDQWQAAIRDDSEPLQISLSYTETIGQLRLGSSLEDALEAIIQDAVTNDNDGLRERWFRATDFLSDATKTTLITFMRDKVLGGGPVDGLVKLLTAAGEQLTARGDFEKRADDAVRHVLRELVGDDAGVAWLSARTDRFATWVSQSSEATRQNLTERMAERARAVEGGPRERLEALASAWGLGALVPPEPTPPSEPPSDDTEGGAANA
ncbi:MAG TPA: P-loop NTPase fold protein [Caulobacteraceae bacterium]|jgi:hypothetical protein